jgi:MarR family transcriptional regulator, temperature-dependent positive regulator of motility
MPTALSSSLQSALHLLHRAGQKADGLFTRYVGNVLTPRQFAILQAVGEANGLSQTDIMAATGIDRSSTAALVGRLVSYGWLKRRRTRRGARLYAVRLTPEGRQVLSQASPAARATEESLLGPLALADRATFLKALALIAAVA